jgi:hypothetical protein
MKILLVPEMFCSRNIITPPAVPVTPVFPSVSAVPAVPAVPVVLTKFHLTSEQVAL